MRALAVLAVIVGLAGPAWAQQDQPPGKPASADAPAIDATKLGVSLSRIQKGLRTAETKAKTNPDGLRLEFNVQVYGTAPRIEFLKDVDLMYGPVPGTAPTHREFVEMVTPPIYRTPVVPISAFAALAAKWMADRSKKSQCEEEIANYRALVMQGVSVSAPRCTQ